MVEGALRSVVLLGLVWVSMVDWAIAGAARQHRRALRIRMR